MQPRSRQTSFGSNSAKSSSPGPPLQFSAPAATRPSGGRLSGLLKPFTPISGQQNKQGYAPPPGAPPSRRGSVNNTQHPAGLSNLATTPSAVYSSSSSPLSYAPRPRSYTSNPYVSADIRPASPRTSVGQMTPAGERARRRSTAYQDQAPQRKGSLAQAQGLEPLKPRKSFFGAVNGIEQPENPEEDVLGDAIRSFALAWEDLFGTTDVENTLINQLFGCVKGLKDASKELSVILLTSFHAKSIVDKAKVVVALDQFTTVLKNAGQLFYSKYPLTIHAANLNQTLHEIAQDKEFHSIFLSALEPLTVLLEMTTDLRRKLVFVVLDALAGGNQSAHLRSTLLLFRNILQMLTGSQVAPAIYALGEFIIALEQVLTEAPALIRSSIAEPLQEKNTESTDTFSSLLNAAIEARATAEPNVELHSLGYSYIPANCTTRVGIISNRFKPVLSEKLPSNALAYEFGKLTEAIGGNSRIARVKRAIASIRQYAPYGKTLIEIARQATKNFVNVQIDKFEGEDNDFKYAFSNVNLVLSTLVPEDFSLDSHSTISFSQSLSFTPNTGIKASLRGLKFSAKSLKYNYSQKGIVGVSDEGSADLEFTADLVINLNATGQFQGYDVNVHTIKFDVNGGEGIKANIYKTFWPYVQSRVAVTINESVRKYIDSNIKSFKSMFDINAPAGGTPAVQVDGPSDVAKQFFQTPRQRKESIQAAAYASSSINPAYAQHPVGARDAFRAEIEKHPELRGNVMRQLENPFSGPPSIGGSRRNSHSHEEQPTGPRRKSMADSLTQTSMADATLTENIHKPKVDHTSLVGADVEGYENMSSALSAAASVDTTGYNAIRDPIIAPEADAETAQAALLRRGSRASVSAVGESATLSDYPVEAHDNTRPHLNEDYPAMSMSLNKRASMDATQFENIQNPPRAEREDTGYAEAQSMSMRDRALSLSGQEVNPTDKFIPVDRYDYMKYGDSAVEDDEEIERGPGPEKQRMMSQSIPKELTVDNTLVENRVRQQEGKPSANAGIPTEQWKGRRMSAALNDEAKADATYIKVRENIASPPQSRSNSITRRKSRPSMTSIKKASMSEMSLNDEVTKDNTILDPNEKVPKGDRRRLSRPDNDELDGEGRGGPGTGASKTKRRPSMAEMLPEDMKKDQTLL
ncbi:hypothetical protein E3Q24_02552 [Wallemia mellicola]|uniref:Uncharacterized protein n=1 Tax=Wallemia mellicola TaxID=1708541 RepID=A0AB74KFP6_9BASI|nr:hypothetical protein E3Q24_02552 [Wallemia mellicola]TIC69295.1 hypothetical protein E3Q03_01352 [Wallemia mellicola]